MYKWHIQVSKCSYSVLTFFAISVVYRYVFYIAIPPQYEFSFIKSLERHFEINLGLLILVYEKLEMDASMTVHDGIGN